ncbi:uncharacterized protein FA14DRAFT_182102 [Meira miltonrushii]|uniref:Uncharacterized protein n=1 Tax=Meira miltonrushii TaxID=1280837 RepID=A0A316V3T1_9BASI|nr:uncharacterized protein FA14DRAFT_182102 [Meira miltonrushii]PWN32190.1 hypothetical protein FA14DRAFT_182102 [Meira miltonrushii]
MADGTSSQTTRRRTRGGQDAKLARNLAAVQALNSSSSRYTTAGRRKPSKSGSSSPSRLKFLLSILLVTTLLLVILQTFRHIRSRSATSTSSFQSRLKRAQAALQSKQNAGILEESLGGWKDRIANAASAVLDDSSAKDPIGSAAAIASQRDDRTQESGEKSLNWKAYMAGMKAHFDDELSKVQQQKKSPEDLVRDTRRKVEAKYAAGSGGGGMAVVPGEGVRDHESPIPFDEQDLPAVEGKSDQEAKQDRKIALEDIDQETLKAMFDALYGRG